MRTLSTAWKSAPSLSAGRLVSASRAVLGRVLRIAKALKHRRESAMLAGFDDRTLNDIGLTRGDVRDAIAEPIWRDPTALLEDRVRERRRSARGFWPKIDPIEAPSTAPACRHPGNMHAPPAR